MNIDKLIEEMSLDDLIGQVLCYQFTEKDDLAEVEEFVKRVKPGGIFLNGVSNERVKIYVDMVNKYAKIPVITTCDVEWGLGNQEVSFPSNMALGAADDLELSEEAGRITAKKQQFSNMHLALAPTIDINMNFHNPVINIRSISDKAEHVAKIAEVYCKGAKSNGLLNCAKHFPGDGLDDRNQHFLTTVNTLSKEEWMSTYGLVWKKMIEIGTDAIMAAHIALPAYENEIDEFYGAPPAVLSKSLMTDLLRGELGFDGCIMSDAMSMIGVCSRIDIEKIASTFLAAGGDFVLFPEKNDFENIKAAIDRGELTVERLKDAVRRVLILKEKAKLFDNKPVKMQDPATVNAELLEVSQKIADKSITVIRDRENILPLDLKRGSRVLMIIMMELNSRRDPTGKEFEPMKAEFEKEGIAVDVMYSPKHYDLENIIDDYDGIIVCCNMNCMNYHGATTRVGWNNIRLFWRGYLLKCKNLVFVSFGDPYKLYDFPYLKTYINAYSGVWTSQRAAAKVIMGKIKAEGKSPVRLEGFFERGI